MTYILTLTNVDLVLELANRTEVLNGEITLSSSTIDTEVSENVTSEELEILIHQIYKGDKGNNGRGIVSIVKTSTSGLVDTYTITYTDSTTSTFQITNSANVTKALIESLLTGNITSHTHNSKQDTLVSGQNIKTINNEPILGRGNLEINSGEWGNITGDIEEQEDLMDALGGLSGRITTIEGKEAVWDSKYAKPSGGIPKNDLSIGVKDSLDKADTALQSHQSLAEYRKASAQDIIDLGITDRLDDIEELIPSEASESNKLTDKDFVNSSIATNTAYFKGTLDATTDLGLTKPASHPDIVTALNAHTFSPVPTNNDYCFVVNSDEDSDVIYDRFKYVTENTSWAYEYSLNNSSFTAAQWASINSGITSTKVGNYDAHLSSTSNPHSVTKAQVGLGNVPNTDFTSRVQTLEGKTRLSDFSEDSTHRLVTDAEKEMWNKGIFWCTWNTTTFAEIAAAVAANKVPVVMYANSLFVWLSFSGGKYWFSAYYQSETYNISVSSSDEWSVRIEYLEVKSNKVSTLSGHESDLNKYPNCKAVADAIGNKLPLSVVDGKLCITYNQ